MSIRTVYVRGMVAAWVKRLYRATKGMLATPHLSVLAWIGALCNPSSRNTPRQPRTTMKMPLSLGSPVRNKTSCGASHTCRIKTLKKLERHVIGLPWPNSQGPVYLGVVCRIVWNICRLQVLTTQCSQRTAIIARAPCVLH